MGHLARTRPVLLSVPALLLLTACASARFEPAPASEALDVELALLGSSSERFPDLRLMLNRDAYVTLAWIAPSGYVRLLSQGHSTDSQFYHAGAHLLPARPTHNDRWMLRATGVRSAVDFGRDRHHESRSLYLALATPEPLDLTPLLEKHERVEASTVQDLAEHLVSLLVSEKTSDDWDNASKEWYWVRW